MIKAVQRADHALLRSRTAVGTKEFPPPPLVLCASDLNYLYLSIYKCANDLNYLYLSIYKCVLVI